MQKRLEVGPRLPGLACTPSLPQGGQVGRPRGSAGRGSWEPLWCLIWSEGHPGHSPTSLFYPWLRSVAKGAPFPLTSPRGPG